MSTQLSLIYATFPSEEEAIKITHELLEKRFVVCINILGPIKSVYSWKDTIHTSEEVAVLLKTTKEKVSSTIAAIQELHLYNTPAILEIPIDQAAASFKQWVMDSVR